MTTQDLMQERVEMIARESGLTLTTDYQYANAGSWSFYDGGFELVARIVFRFNQGRYASFEADQYGGLPHPCGHWTPDEFKDALEGLRAFVSATV